MNLEPKSLTLGLSVGLGLPLLYTILRGIAGEGRDKKLHRKIVVGIEIGVNNYVVGIGEPILNNKGEITDFNITKRKNGTTDQNP
jgi:hypothetical protein